MNLAGTAARARGFHDLRRVVLPHPMEGRPTSEIVQIAEARLEEIAGLLTRPA